MPTHRRTFDREFKLQILNEVDTGRSVVEVAREHAVHPEMIYKWRRQQRKYGARTFAGRGNAYTDEAKIEQLERTCGQLAAENAFLKKAISVLRETDVDIQSLQAYGSQPHQAANRKHQTFPALEITGLRNARSP